MYAQGKATVLGGFNNYDHYPTLVEQYDPELGKYIPIFVLIMILIFELVTEISWKFSEKPLKINFVCRSLVSPEGAPEEGKTIFCSRQEGIFSIV